MSTGKVIERVHAAWQSTSAALGFFGLWTATATWCGACFCMADFFVQACLNGSGFGQAVFTTLLLAVAPPLGLAAAVALLCDMMRRVEVVPAAGADEPSAAARALSRWLARTQEPFRSAMAVFFLSTVGGLAAMAVLGTGLIVPWAFGHNLDKEVELPAVMWLSLATGVLFGGWFVRRISRRVVIARAATAAA